MKPNRARNQKIVEMYASGEYTFQELADIFKIRRQTAHEIYERETRKSLSKAKKKLSGVIHK